MESVNSTISRKDRTLRLVDVLPKTLLLNVMYSWDICFWRRISRKGDRINLGEVCFPTVERFGKKMSQGTVHKLFHGSPVDWSSTFGVGLQYQARYVFYESHLGNLCYRCRRRLHHISITNVLQLDCRVKLRSKIKYASSERLQTIILNKKYWCAMCCRVSLFRVCFKPQLEEDQSTEELSEGCLSN